MTQKAEPELVTSGPYRFVRDPIYTGPLLALLGTALVTTLTGSIILAVLSRVVETTEALICLRRLPGLAIRAHSSSAAAQFTSRRPAR